MPHVFHSSKHFAEDPNDGEEQGSGHKDDAKEKHSKARVGPNNAGAFSVGKTFRLLAGEHHLAGAVGGENSGCFRIFFISKEILADGDQHFWFAEETGARELSTDHAHAKTACKVIN